MKRSSRIASLALIASLAGCYQVVQTGRAPGPVVVSHRWTATWLWGLVPAQEINVTSPCPSGVATVETPQSFLTGFVWALNSGIVTPIQGTITC